MAIDAVGVCRKSLTILDLAHSCLDIIQGQVGYGVLQAVEIHLGGGCSPDADSVVSSNTCANFGGNQIG